MAEISKARLVALSDAKLHDAKLLLNAGSSGNAYYLAGYAIELTLKAILSAQFKADTLPDRSLLKDVFTHDFSKLVKMCRLEDELKLRRQTDVEFEGFWQIVDGWDEASRYGDVTRDDASNLVRAIEGGILPWLRSKL
ncbi:MAG: HEPN domain-containing protein [Rhodopseudomonas palustris]|uniref:HEPN domain-containing protein n=1 Tax=Rhodopseudomonas palustris TaxID=1076 RepID=A0A933RWH4_RHOPL|nr:HEPN domain-containing protein [Rhodopseudomonas palustris]